MATAHLHRENYRVGAYHFVAIIHLFPLSFVSLSQHGFIKESHQVAGMTFCSQTPKTFPVISFRVNQVTFLETYLDGKKGALISSTQPSFFSFFFSLTTFIVQGLTKISQVFFYYSSLSSRYVSMAILENFAETQD